MSDELLYQGWLAKKGKIHRNWLRRFFVLHPTTLEYFTNEKCSVSKGVISLRNAMCYVPSTTEMDKLFALAIKTEKRTYYLQADTQQELLKWNEEIFNTISDLFMSTKRKTMAPPALTSPVVSPRLGAFSTPMASPRPSSSLSPISAPSKQPTISTSAPHLRSIRTSNSENNILTSKHDLPSPSDSPSTTTTTTSSHPSLTSSQSLSNLHQPNGMTRNRSSSNSSSSHSPREISSSAPPSQFRIPIPLPNNPNGIPKRVLPAKPPPRSPLSPPVSPNYLEPIAEVGTPPLPPIAKPTKKLPPVPARTVTPSVNFSVS